MASLLHPRIPVALWCAAVELARQHGLNAAVRPLRLDYQAESFERAVGEGLTLKTQAQNALFCALYQDRVGVLIAIDEFHCT